jgi:hypothetical protein
MRYLYLLVALLAGVVAAKLQTRWASVCANVPCAHLQARLAVIDQMIAARAKAPVYLVIGDSLTEIGRWPTLCGRDPVPAGVSGARTDTWVPHAKIIADSLNPEFVVLALGTNDVLTRGRLGPYEKLASSLSGRPLIAVPVHEMPAASREVVREANRRIAAVAARQAEPIVAATTDGVHLTADDYARWFAAIEEAACPDGKP